MVGASCLVSSGSRAFPTLTVAGSCVACWACHLVKAACAAGAAGKACIRTHIVWCVGLWQAVGGVTARNLWSPSVSRRPRQPQCSGPPVIGAAGCSGARLRPAEGFPREWGGFGGDKQVMSASRGRGLRDLAPKAPGPFSEVGRIFTQRGCLGCPRSPRTLSDADVKGSAGCERGGSSEAWCRLTHLATRSWGGRMVEKPSIDGSLTLFVGFKKRFLKIKYPI